MVVSKVVYCAKYNYSCYQCREPLGEGNSMPVQRSSLKTTADSSSLAAVNVDVKL